MNRKEILDLVKEGTITAEEGIRLLEAVESNAEKTESSANQSKSSSTGRMLRVVVDSNEDGKASKVRVNVPVSFLKLAMATGKGLDINGMKLSETVDMDMIIKAIDDGALGEIVNVESDEANVKVFID